MTTYIQNKKTHLLRQIGGFGGQAKQKDNGRETSRVFSYRHLNIGLICLIILTGFFYLTQVNASAVKGYIIADLGAKLEAAQTENRKLELTSQSLQSVGDLAEKTKELGLVDAGQVEYLQAPGGVVAVAR
ncbi:MAG: hypothetical protein WCT37_02860 [Patescibacteria group bacterium]|jgi:hypothetical protein